MELAPRASVRFRSTNLNTPFRELSRLWLEGSDTNKTNWRVCVVGQKSSDAETIKWMGKQKSPGKENPPRDLQSIELCGSERDADADGIASLHTDLLASSSS